MLKQITSFFKNAVSFVLQRVKNRKYSDQYLKDIVKNKNLKHVAITADGNRRWAKERGLSPLEGHRKGFLEVAPQLCDDLWRLGVQTVTIWCFSIGNRKRAKDEVDNLMNCFDMMIKNILPKAQKEGIRLVHMGRKDWIPEFLKKTIVDVEEKTKSFDKYFLNLAIDYSGSDEIARTYKKISDQEMDITHLTEEAIVQFSDLGDQPFAAPDVLIRPSRAFRTSAFMPFQIAYTELCFVGTYFPDFDSSVLKKVILEFASRKRTFSK